jgi:hypothetical protein
VEICSLCSKYVCLAKLKNIYISLGRKACVLEEGTLARCFPVGIEVVCERNTSCNFCASDGDRLCLLQIGLFS